MPLTGSPSTATTWSRSCWTSPTSSWLRPTQPRAAAGTVRDLPGWNESVVSASATGPAPASGLASGPITLGAVGGAASVQVPLGMLTGPQARLIADLAADDDVVVTPWRGLVIGAAAHSVTDLRGVGLITDPGSSWARISACVGAPHCGRTRVDTRAVALRLVETDAVHERTHVSGCERRCGAPTGAFRDLVPVG